MTPRLGHVLLALVLAILPAASASEFAAAEASASRQGRDALGATTAAIAEADLRRHVTRLASEEYEGRGTGRRGGRMATAYLAAFFEGLGLRPEGDEGSYFQEFEFPAGMELTGNNRLSLEIDEPVGLVRRFRPGEHYQPLSMSTGGTVEAGVVFAGFGIKAKDYDSFEGLEVNGKWLLVFRGNPAERKDLARFGPLVAKAKLAKEKGAAGIIFIKGTNPAVTGELIDPSSAAGGRNQILPAITITDRLAASMLTGKSGDEELKALFEAYDREDRTEGFPLPYQLAAEIGLKAHADTGRNVLGRLATGAEPSAEVLVVGAHVDHIGRGERGGSRAKGADATRIHFGADDNASGVAALMELAQSLADRQAAGNLDLRRDIVFAVWSGEEIGLHGSRRYLAKAGESGGSLHPAVAAYLNLDMVGRATENGLRLHGTASSSAWDAILDTLGEVEGLEVTRTPSPYVPSDSISFYKAEVPILAAFTGLHDAFHTPNDTVEKIDFAGLERVTRYMLSLTAAVAAVPEAPDYVEVPRERKGK